MSPACATLEPLMRTAFHMASVGLFSTRRATFLRELSKMEYKMESADCIWIKRMQCIHWTCTTATSKPKKFVILIKSYAPQNTRCKSKLKFQRNTLIWTSPRSGVIRARKAYSRRIISITVPPVRVMIFARIVLTNSRTNLKDSMLREKSWDG